MHYRSTQLDLRGVAADVDVVDEQFVVDLEGVSRSFGDVEALSDLTIKVPHGRVSVLLGPNGAGKTTAIRMITGALAPHRGTARVFGLDPVSADGAEVRRRCGVVSAKPALYDRLSGLDNLRYAAELYGLGRGDRVIDRIHDAARQFGIDGALDAQVGGYSTGMKTRLALSRSILADPELLLLDEPTSGLDPESAVAVLELIRQMASDGRTVLMCTHLLLEAEGLADEVVVMQGGRSLVAGPPDALAARYWPTPSVRFSASSPDDLASVARMAGVGGVTFDGAAATVEVDTLERVPELVYQLVSSGARLAAVEPFRPTLEDLYFAVRRETGQHGGAEVAPPSSGTGRIPRRSRVAEMAR